MLPTDGSWLEGHSQSIQSDRSPLNANVAFLYGSLFSFDRIQNNATAFHGDGLCQVMLVRRETERPGGEGGPLALFNIPHYLAPNMEIRDVDLLFEVNGSTILEANTFKRRAETRKYLGG